MTRAPIPHYPDASGKSAMLDPAIVARLLRYEPETGKLFWLAREPSDFTPTGRLSAAGLCATHNARWAGKEAFPLRPNGYRGGTVQRIDISAHRVIWAIVHGEWPDGQIDHINGDPSDNRLANLRVVTSQENMRNTAIYSTNKSGHIGVHWEPRRKLWHASIGNGGKQKKIGAFKSFEKAVAARKAAEVALGYHPNHGRAKT